MPDTEQLYALDISKNMVEVGSGAFELDITIEVNSQDLISFHCSDVTARIYYTLDGSTPNTNSKYYQGSYIKHNMGLQNSNSVIKAVAYNSSTGEQSDIVTYNHSYSTPSQGDTIWVDGIEYYVLYANSSNYSWGSKYILVDKNYDISHYYTSASTFEFGGYNESGYAISTTAGDGFANSNTNINGTNSKVPETSSHKTIWQALTTLRSSYGNYMFIPSRDELMAIYNARTNLNGLATDSWYWSSSALSGRVDLAWYVLFSSGGQYNFSRGNTCYCRACRAF